MPDNFIFENRDPAALEENIQSQQKRSFAEWQKLGKDRNSIVTDPLFIDPENLDFRFRSTRVARKIGFTPFDYSKAGVYGDPEWINLAKLDPALIEEFNKAIAKNKWTGE